MSRKNESIASAQHPNHNASRSPEQRMFFVNGSLKYKESKKDPLLETLNKSKKVLHKNQSARNIQTMEQRDNTIRRGAKCNQQGSENSKPNFNGTTLFKSNGGTMSRNKSTYINFNQTQ